MCLFDDLGLGRDRWVIEILDEDRLVALFIEEQFVNQLFGHQNTEATRTKPARFALGHVTKRVLGRIRNSSVLQFILRKTLARVFDAANYSALGPYVADFHILRRIEFAAMLHGVEQYLTERSGDFLGFRIGKLRCFPEKLEKAIGGEDIAANG